MDLQGAFRPLANNWDCIISSFSSQASSFLDWESTGFPGFVAFRVPFVGYLASNCVNQCFIFSSMKMEILEIWSFHIAQGSPNFDSLKLASKCQGYRCTLSCLAKFYLLYLFIYLCIALDRIACVPNWL